MPRPIPLGVPGVQGPLRHVALVDPDELPPVVPLQHTGQLRRPDLAAIAEHRSQIAGQRIIALPSYMGVIVSSHVTKSGSTISGDIPEIVVVKTNPGYSNDPGHPGSGTVQAIYCHIS
jgi:hypothetical protein